MAMGIGIVKRLVARIRTIVSTKAPWTNFMHLSLLPKISQTTKIEDLTLEEHLEQMRFYGKPRVSLQSNGWYCVIEMNTNTTGTSFDVKSEFDCESPRLAAKMCHERMLNALKELTK